MLFGNITVASVEACIAVVNDRYAGNLVGEWQARTTHTAPTALNAAGTRWRGRIIVRDSYGPGARTSATGRHGPYACWHAFRDVFAEVFRVYGPAGVKITTGMATYTPDNWEARYPETGRANIGSRMDPVTMPMLCACGDAGPAPMERKPGRRKPSAPQPGRTYYAARPQRHIDMKRLRDIVTGVVEVDEGECLTCEGPTGSREVMFCSAQCQMLFHSTMTVPVVGA